MSNRPECAPSSFQGRSLSVSSDSGARITTAAPLVPRCVRPSVRNNPCPWNLTPKDEAIVAWRTTGR